MSNDEIGTAMRVRADRVRNSAAATTAARSESPGGAAARVRPAGPRGATVAILGLVALLAAIGVVASLFVRWERTAAAPERSSRPADPTRVYAVADAIDHRQMRPVWTLVNMTGLDRQCEKARAFTVVREAEGPAAVPTWFIIYCREQGFWVVEADPERERWGTVGPLPSREAAEAVIDRDGEFLWGSRPPRFRPLERSSAADG